MPAPSFVTALPRPVLFGLYGMVGGLVGALLFGELVWWLFRPSPPAEASADRQRIFATRRRPAT